jgi:hypothetical protein
MCDEFGLMAYVEHAASNPMQDSPQMSDRFDRSVSETIRRDRNHPSVTMLRITHKFCRKFHGAGRQPLKIAWISHGFSLARRLHGFGHT